MNAARIDHVTDVRDTRPVFLLVYRKYSDTRPSSITIQADNDQHAVGALVGHLGTTQMAVLSLRQI